MADEFMLDGSNLPFWLTTLGGKVFHAFETGGVYPEKVIYRGLTFSKVLLVSDLKSERVEAFFEGLGQAAGPAAILLFDGPNGMPPSGEVAGAAVYMRFGAVS